MATFPLRFSCTRCGACCRWPGVVYLRRGEAARIARRKGMTVDELRRRYLCRLPDGRWAIEVEEGSDGCPFLEGDLCSIQDVKPGQCSSYPFWDELLASKAAWNREAAHCPGIGQGPELEEEQVHKLRVLDPGSP